MGKLLKLQRQNEQKMAGGTALIANLCIRAGARRLDANGLASELGVTAAYMSQLLAGLRDAEMCGHRFLVACAQFLELPTVYVYVLADVIALGEVEALDADTIWYMREIAMEYSHAHDGKFILEANEEDVFED